MKLFTSATKTVIAAASVTAALTTVATLRCFHRRLAAPETGSRTPFDLTQAPSLALSQAWLMVSRREWRGRSLQELDPRAPPNTRRGEFGEAGRQAAEYPPLRTSTVMFLHIFKCAGSTLRWGVLQGDLLDVGFPSQRQCRLLCRLRGDVMNFSISSQPFCFSSVP